MAVVPPGHRFGARPRAPGREPLNRLLRGAYALAGAAADLAASVAAREPVTDDDGKLRRALAARHDLVPALVAAATAVRDPGRPLAWFHAPSVGEGLQARPVIDALRAGHPALQVAYTFYSPSAERFAAGIGADITGFLPFDRAEHADALLEAFRPSVLVFAKLDVWPVLVERAVARGVPVALVSGTLAEGSGRAGWWSRALLHDAYAALGAVGAIDAAHARRLVALGASAAVVEVTGDTRFDQVAQRAARADRDGALLAPLRAPRFTCVAGSTWPADEGVLLPAWEALRARHPDVRLVIAPHEPTPAHCAPIEAWAARAGATLARLSALSAPSRRGGDPGDAAPQGHSAWTRSATDPLPVAGPGDVDVLLVDRMGVLGDLYALADIAVVGGGFHAAGLHSVIEPAAFGVPVAFGPGHRRSREAGLLLGAGAATAVTSPDAMAEWLLLQRRDAPARRRAGEAARRLVAAELGATARSAAMVARVAGWRTARS